MNLNYTYEDLANIIDAEISGERNGTFQSVAFDTRRIHSTQAQVFFALKSQKNDGHIFVEQAYDKGVRCFVISQDVSLPNDACCLKVEDTLDALQIFAKKHREQFSYPVIAITGSYGKTMAKEWLYSLLKDEFNIVRSPKSYNSQLGVALSLLELNAEHNLALIEAGISEPGEMELLEDMIDPTMGVFTGIGNAHAENFESEKIHLKEKLRLFKHANFVFAEEKYASPFRRSKINVEFTSKLAVELGEKGQTPFKNTLSVCIECALFLGVAESDIAKNVETLPTVASRLEIISGAKENLIINDTYSLDLYALEQALNFLFSIQEKENKVLVMDISSSTETEKAALKDMIASYALHKCYLLNSAEELPLEVFELESSAILFKGKHNSFLKSELEKFKEKKHDTWLEIDQSAIVENLNYYRSKLNSSTKLLCMVKASSYGSGDVKMAQLLEQNGADYLGVAYADEGVDLRKSGIQLPIMIMNTSESAFSEIVNHSLEPAIYDLDQLEKFIRYLIQIKQLDYPIHLKVETGMNRLGFQLNEMNAVFELLQAQPEVKVKSVYSHLANGDKKEDEYTLHQANRFKEFKTLIEDKLGSNIDFHILNSAGIENFPEFEFTMVRLGIGMYGYGQNNKLKSSLKWLTRISQVRIISKGETVGYGRNFEATQESKIAILPLGYSDGLRRALGNGKIAFYLNGSYVKTIGNICMDMCMIDVTGIECKKGDLVEIIGPHTNVFKMSESLNTIVYEVMTGISKRVERVYIQS